MLTFRENVVPNISQQVIQMLQAKMFHSFEELLTFFMKDRLHFIRDNAKAKGEISDLPNSIIFRTFGILSISYFVGRFTILPDDLFLDDDYEIDILVKQIMSALRV